MWSDDGQLNVASWKSREQSTGFVGPHGQHTGFIDGYYLIITPAIVDSRDIVDTRTHESIIMAYFNSPQLAAGEPGAMFLMKMAY